MRFTLPISPDYVAHWGLWEAVREIYQNALDQGGADLRYSATAQQLSISSTGKLTPETLVLGTSSKRDDDSKRGKFGEGYKLALLVLLRREHHVTIYTGNETWTPKLEHDPQFNATVLNIYTEECDRKFNEVLFSIDNVTPDEENEIRGNLRANPNEPDTILEDESEAGRVYVGGLFVATVKGFKAGYSFKPGTVKLDRDRGMIDGFDLAYETSRLWTTHGGRRAITLMTDKAPDVQYVESFAVSSSTLAMHTGRWFNRTYGRTAIPVSTQEEIQRASSAGVKWVLVPEAVKNILRIVKSWVLPSTESPVQRLKKFRERYHYSLSTTARQELDEIIQIMEQ